MKVGQRRKACWFTVLPEFPALWQSQWPTSCSRWLSPWMKRTIWWDRESRTFRQISILWASCWILRGSSHLVSFWVRPLSGPLPTRVSSLVSNNRFFLQTEPIVTHQEEVQRFIANYNFAYAYWIMLVLSLFIFRSVERSLT